MTIGVRSSRRWGTHELRSKVASHEARGNARSTGFPRLVSAVGTGLRRRMGYGEATRAGYGAPESDGVVMWVLVGLLVGVSLALLRQLMRADQELDRVRWELHSEKGKRRDLESRLVRLLQKPRVD